MGDKTAWTMEAPDWMRTSSSPHVEADDVKDDVEPPAPCPPNKRSIQLRTARDLVEICLQLSAEVSVTLTLPDGTPLRELLINHAARLGRFELMPQSQQVELDAFSSSWSAGDYRDTAQPHPGSDLLEPPPRMGQSSVEKLAGPHAPATLLTQKRGSLIMPQDFMRARNFSLCQEEMRANLVVVGDQDRSDGGAAEPAPNYHSAPLPSLGTELPALASLSEDQASAPPVIWVETVVDMGEGTSEVTEEAAVAGSASAAAPAPVSPATSQGAPRTSALFGLTSHRLSGVLETSVQRKGYLHKESHRFKNHFKRRFFVLVGARLAYYESEAEYAKGDRPIDVIPLENGCNAGEPKQKRSRPHCLRLDLWDPNNKSGGAPPPRNRAATSRNSADLGGGSWWGSAAGQRRGSLKEGHMKYILAADTAEDMAGWCKALVQAEQASQKPALDVIQDSPEAEREQKKSGSPANRPLRRGSGARGSQEFEDVLLNLQQSDKEHAKKAATRKSAEFEDAKEKLEQEFRKGGKKAKKKGSKEEKAHKEDKAHKEESKEGHKKHHKYEHKQEHKQEGQGVRFDDSPTKKAMSRSFNDAEVLAEAKQKETEQKGHHKPKHKHGKDKDGKDTAAKKLSQSFGKSFGGRGPQEEDDEEEQPHEDLATEGGRRQATQRLRNSLLRDVLPSFREDLPGAPVPVYVLPSFREDLPGAPVPVFPSTPGATPGTSTPGASSSAPEPARGP